VHPQARHVRALRQRRARPWCSASRELDENERTGGLPRSANVCSHLLMRWWRRPAPVLARAARMVARALDTISTN
jgi:hypothetical protein